MHRNLPLIVFPLAKLVLHLVTFRGYGMFRDEFYYLACASRPALGYVDHPPFAMWLLALVKTALGDSLLAVRLVPALAGAATVLVCGLIARRLGGGRPAECLAMLAALAAPGYLALNHFYSMNALDILIWALAGWLLLDVLERDTPGRWALLGAVLGVGLLNKLSVLWLGLGLAVGLLATHHRGRLATPGPWIAAGLAVAMFAPHLAWQVAHDWPTLEFIRNATQNKMAATAPWSFLWSQAMLMNVATLPLWLAGLVVLFRDDGARRRRVLAVAYLVVLALLIVNGSSRAGYLAPAYTWLFAAGAVAAERTLTRWRRAPLWGYAAAVAVSGVAFAPFALPVLPVERYIAYASRMGIGPSTEERKELGALPQFYADMHGWESIVGTVARVYAGLPPADRARASIFTFNYGDAGAIDYYGRDYGLPGAIGGHNSYWLWGPGERSGDVVLVVGDEREDVERSFESVEPGATIDCGLCMPYENDRTVWIARGIRAPLEEIWPRVKHYD